MSFVRVCAASEVPEGRMAAFFVDDVEVLVVHTPDGLRAYDGLCPHEYFALVDGYFDGSTITCAGHRWIFDARTGRGVAPSNCRLVQFPAKVDGDDLLVDPAE
jgi:toluene monooxygenase system ferredoxin subunit